MRRHIRHPTDLPIDVRMSDVIPKDRDYLRNIGWGGLCFVSQVPISPGLKVQIEIPIADPMLETVAEVVWCEEAEGGYEVGARFAESDAESDRILVDGVCLIESYKLDVWVREGRRIDGEQAALEWLSRGQ